MERKRVVCKPQEEKKRREIRSGRGEHAGKRRGGRKIEKVPLRRRIMRGKTFGEEDSEGGAAGKRRSWRLTQRRGSAETWSTRQHKKKIGS